MPTSPQAYQENVIPKGLLARSNDRVEIDREGVVQAHIGLVRYLAERMATNLPTWVDTDDLVGAGLLGLLDAVDKFDPSRCVLFKTYAEKRIRGAMLDSLRTIDWVPRSIRRRARETKAAVEKLHQEFNREPTEDEIAAALGLSPLQFRQLNSDLNRVNLIAFDLTDSDSESLAPLQLQAHPAESPLDVYEAKQRCERIRKAVASLPDRERKVIVLYYLRELSMSEVASDLGVTVSRVSQIHSQAIKRLRDQLNSEQLEARLIRNVVRFSKSVGGRTVSTIDTDVTGPGRRDRSARSTLSQATPHPQGKTAVAGVAA